MTQIKSDKLNVNSIYASYFSHMIIKFHLRLEFFLSWFAALDCGLSHSASHVITSDMIFKVKRQTACYFCSSLNDNNLINLRFQYSTSNRQLMSSHKTKHNCSFSDIKLTTSCWSSSSSKTDLLVKVVEVIFCLICKTQHDNEGYTPTKLQKPQQLIKAKKCRCCLHW